MTKVVKLFKEEALGAEERGRSPVKLLKRFVEGIKPDPDRDVVVWDAELPGFCIRVKPSGVRSYAVQYRNAEGKSRRLTIGRHGVLTAEEARGEARQKLAAAKRGGDPLAERRAAHKKAKAAQTVKQLADRYLKEHAEVRKKPSSVKEDRRLIEKRIVPDLGKKPVDALTREHILELHHSLRKTPYEANRCLALLSKMLNLAELWELRTQGSNPCKHVARYAEKRRERFLNDKELARLGKTLEQMEQSRTEQPGVIIAFKLLALTGCRLSEILNLEWPHVDLAAGVLRLPDAKAGARLVPLGDAAVTFLSTLPRRGEYVAPGRQRGKKLPFFTAEGAWSRIRKKARLEGARLHDLRHTVGSLAGQQGWNAFTVKAMLGHKTLAMTDRYVAHDMSPLRRAANSVSGRIAEAMKAGAKAHGNGGERSPR
jgi:integrase